MTYQVLLYYCFAPIDRPEENAEVHRTVAKLLGLLGRVLIAEEGINGTVSGLRENTAVYMNWLRSQPGMAEMEFKVDESNEHAFKRLRVQAREEIVTLGVPLSQRPEQFTGTHLSPPEWRAMMERDDVVLLDGRNAYESELGRFKNAICPPLQNFRDFPEWLENNRKIFENKKILSYCTGGIRCEKLTNWMLHAGFQDVFQLHGGIVEYGKHPEVQGEGFEGVNVVFDERVTVSVGPKASALTLCTLCATPTSNYVNCANLECNKRMVICPNCEAQEARCCSETCRTAPRLRLKGKKWHETTRKIETR